MSKRKPHDRAKRLDRIGRSMIARHNVAVVNVSTGDGETQGVIDLRTVRNIAPSPELAHAVCGLPHQWAVFAAVLCVGADGREYLKHTSIIANERYKSDSLEGMLRDELRGLLDSCNPPHVRGTAWIASATGEELDVHRADQVLTACGAWRDCHNSKKSFMENVTV